MVSVVIIICLNRETLSQRDTNTKRTKKILNIKEKRKNTKYE